MIVEQVTGNIFAAPQKHIAFAVNTHGYNDADIAEEVAARIKPERFHTNIKKLGEVITYGESSTKTYHALVCRSIGLGAWNDTPRFVQECLDKIEVPEDEEIAVALMGIGRVGIKQGADVEAILKGMNQSKKKLVVYRL